MKKHLSTIILILIFLIGLCVLLYPSVSNYINQIGASHATKNYDKLVSQFDEETITKIIEAANEYNRNLFTSPKEFTNGDVKDLEYKELLKITEDGMMGYLTISKLGVNLPIYHGTTDEILDKTVGHLEGSSLPVGGNNTHSILTAHRGLPTAKLFTNLDKMEIGDTFTITILNKVIRYQVDDIKVVLPNELETLEIVEDKEYVTLVTCTPYAVNTHRLLVRGIRSEIAETQIIPADALQIDSIILAPILAAPMLIILLVILIISSKKKRKLNWREVVNGIKK